MINHKASLIFLGILIFKVSYIFSISPKFSANFILVIWSSALITIFYILSMSRKCDSPSALINLFYPFKFATSSRNISIALIILNSNFFCNPASALSLSSSSLSFQEAYIFDILLWNPFTFISSLDVCDFIILPNGVLSISWYVRSCRSIWGFS